MSDAAGPPSDVAWERLMEAKQRGGTCAVCGRKLDVGEAVWRQRLKIRRNWGAYFGETGRWGLVGRECAAPELLAASEGREPVACGGCGRGMHYPVARSRRATVCSVRCRTREQERLSKGGQPS